MMFQLDCLCFFFFKKSQDLIFFTYLPLLFQQISIRLQCVLSHFTFPCIFEVCHNGIVGEVEIAW